MPDLPHDQTTTASIEVGEFYYSTISQRWDRDWVRLDLTEGQYVQVTVRGNHNNSNELDDPIVRIFDQAGTEVAFDDSYNGSEALVTLQASYTGSYYIEAAGVLRTTGGYVVGVAEAAPPLENTVLEAISWGTQLDASEPINVHFGDRGDTQDGLEVTYTSLQFNDYERAQMLSVLHTIETMTDLEFNIVMSPDEADFNILLASTGNASLGLMFPPGEVDEGLGVFNAGGQGWDRTAGGGLDQGGLGYNTLVHEFLHGQGLAHPHYRGGTSTGIGGFWGEYYDDSLQLNQGIHTVMSYNFGYVTGDYGSHDRPLGDFGYMLGPMALDIAVLQSMYGTGDGHQAGGNTYSLIDENVAGIGWTAIWDTGGHDVISYDGTSDAIIDLRMASLLREDAGAGGRVSTVSGIAAGYTIANGVVIEVGRGGLGDDHITGNGANNVLLGRAGNDTVIGGGGNDVLRGGNGQDTLSGNMGQDTVLGQTGDDHLYGQHGRDFMQGGAGHDTMFGGQGADHMEGGNSRDQIYGGSEADSIYGQQGNDWLQGDQGADHLFGGSGSDMFIYTSASDSLNTTNRRDVIADFTRGQDRIDLSAIDAAYGIKGDQAFAFRGSLNLQDTDIGQIRFNAGPGNSVVVAVDINADGRGDMHILVQGVSSLTAADFIL